MLTDNVQSIWQQITVFLTPAPNESDTSDALDIGADPGEKKKSGIGNQLQMSKPILALALSVFNTQPSPTSHQISFKAAVPKTAHAVNVL